MSLKKRRREERDGAVTSGGLGDCEVGGGGKAGECGELGAVAL